MSATTTVHETAQGIDSPPVRGYQYKHGDRPLDGYVIQRGAGRGGFGEVYYAISDSGREVALKLITTYEQIELRGISQCMNLKSPHLVTIFDVRYGTDGRPWVIMEYIGGPSLRQLLDASPSGLGTQKAAFFLREIGKGLSYLHECGIVHRDLKPANIFYENGTVKICDYGLSKVISTSHHSGQTVTVGTVHYMAPEIGAGNYDRGIDIYALGALLFEMLTGQVPFFGSSTTEVLMKHLSSEVDTSAVEEPFRTVVRKAMAKNPADRYQSVQEMVEAVFGSEHVRNSVSAFSPDSLTMVAGYAAQKAAHVQGADTFTPSDTPAPATGKPSWQCDRWGRMAGVMDRVAAKKGEFAAAFGAKANKSPDFVDPFRSTVGDPLRFWHRIVLSGIAVCMVGMVGGLVADHEKGPSAFVALMATGWATGMAMVAWYFIAPALRNESAWLTRLAIGGTAGIGSIIFSLPFWDTLHMSGTALAIFGGFVLMNWRERLSANRPERVVLWNVIAGALLGFVLSAMFNGNPPLAAVVLAGTSLAAGIAAPWSRGNRGGAFPVSPAPSPKPLTPTPPMPQPIPMPSGEPRIQQPVSPPMIPPLPQFRTYSRRVPRAFRGIWLAAFVGFATLGLFLLMMMLTVRVQDDERALMCGFGTGALIFAAFALRRSRRMFHDGPWEYFFRPMIQLLCVQAILVSSSILLFGRIHDNDMPPAIFFIVFPTIVLFVLTFFTGRGGSMTQPPPIPAALPSTYAPSNYSMTVGGVVLGFGRIVFNVVGSLVLTFSLLMALAVVTNLPGLFESGLVDPQFPRDMEKAFGTPHWPRIMVQIGATICFVSAMIASGLLLLPRRHVGAAHMFRAIVGIGVLFGGIMVLGHGLPDWGYVSQSNAPGVNLDLYLQSVRTPNVFLGGAMSMFGIFVLLWPARRRTAAPQVNYNFSPVMQQEPQIHHPA